MTSALGVGTVAKPVLPSAPGKTLYVDVDELTLMCRRVAYLVLYVKFVAMNTIIADGRRCQKRRMTSMEQATKHAQTPQPNQTISLSTFCTTSSIPKHQTNENANGAELFSSRLLGLLLVTLTSRWYGEFCGTCR